MEKLVGFLIPSVAVGIGGGLGSFARFSINFWLAPMHLQMWAMAGINILGSFAIGIALSYMNTRSALTFFIVTGVLGGFTSFSAFSWDVVQMLQRGQVMLALALVLVSVVGSILACAFGMSPILANVFK